MSPSVSGVALARAIGDALMAGGSEQPDQERAYVTGQLARGEVDVQSAVEQLSAGVSPYHVFGRYQLPSTDVTIEVHRAVMPPGSMTEDVIGIVRAVSTSKRPRALLDLGCGTGVLGIAALMTSRSMRGILLDVDWEAAACASRNLARAGLSARAGAVRGNGVSSVRSASIELLIANLPFVPDAEIQLLPARFRVHTPASAVRGGGADGLEILRQLAPAMAAVAAPTGQLVLQVGNAHQKAAAAGLLAECWEPVEQDRIRHPNVLVASRRSH